MFKLGQRRLYWRTVKLSMPDADGALHEEAFDVQFEWLDDESYTALFERAAVEQRKDREVAPEFVRGFRHVQAVDGTELPFTAENLASLLAEPVVASVIVRAYLDSRSEAAEKNFARPPAAGPAAALSSTTRH